MVEADNEKRRIPVAVLEGASHFMFQTNATNLDFQVYTTNKVSYPIALDCVISSVNASASQLFTMRKQLNNQLSKYSPL